MLVCSSQADNSVLTWLLKQKLDPTTVKIILSSLLKVGYPPYRNIFGLGYKIGDKCLWNRDILVPELQSIQRIDCNIAIVSIWKWLKQFWELSFNWLRKFRWLIKRQNIQWGSVTRQMAVPVPSINCCVLNCHNLFYQIQNALAFVVNAAFLFFETSKLWALIMYICRIDGKPKD